MNRCLVECSGVHLPISVHSRPFTVLYSFDLPTEMDVSATCNPNRVLLNSRILAPNGWHTYTFLWSQSGHDGIDR